MHLVHQRNLQNQFKYLFKDRKKSAAERLEADKMKYVKSEKVRQKRITSGKSLLNFGMYSMSTSGPFKLF